jgi:hypothetical protein
MCNNKTCEYYKKDNNDGSENADWCNYICDCGAEYVICEQGGCMKCPLTFLNETIPSILYTKNRKLNWFYKKRMFLWFKKYLSLKCDKQVKFNFKKSYNKNSKIWTIKITINTEMNIGLDDYRGKLMYSIFEFIKENSGKYWKYLNDKFEIEITNKFRNSEEYGECYYTHL